jgi:hypothetical protein
MAIVTMTSREDFETHPGDPNYWIEPFYPGSEAGLLRHSPACPHYKPDTAGREIGPGYADCVGWNDPRAREITEVRTGVYGTGNGGKSGYIAGHCDGPFEPLYMKRTHVGLVLEDRERNGYDDSDFYAIVWNPETCKPESIPYGTTRAWTYPNGCAVDAPPEILAAYKAWQEARAKEARKEYEAREAATPRKGKVVEVVKGRKVPKGTRGEVIWLGEGSYGPRVGIKDLAGAVHWTSVSNVRVVLPLPVTEADRLWAMDRTGRYHDSKDNYTGPKQESR